MISCKLTLRGFSGRAKFETFKMPVPCILWRNYIKASRLSLKLLHYNFIIPYIEKKSPDFFWSLLFFFLFFYFTDFLGKKTEAAPNLSDSYSRPQKAKNLSRILPFFPLAFKKIGKQGRKNGKKAEKCIFLKMCVMQSSTFVDDVTKTLGKFFSSKKASYLMVHICEECFFSTGFKWSVSWSGKRPVSQENFY